MKEFWKSWKFWAVVAAVILVIVTVILYFKCPVFGYALSGFIIGALIGFLIGHFVKIGDKDSTTQKK